MTTFQLPDLTEGTLKKAGMNFGIKDAENLRKEQLIQEIKKASKTEGELLLVPLVIAPQPQAAQSHQPSVPVQVTVAPAKRGRGWWIPGALFLLSSLSTVATALLTYNISVANADSAKTAREQYMSEIQKIREAARAEATQSWQELMVYDIISRGQNEKENWNGLSLAEIKRRYRIEATQGVLAKEVELDNKHVSDAAIKKVLFCLMRPGLIHATSEDRYIVATYLVNPLWQRSAN